MRAGLVSSQNVLTGQKGQLTSEADRPPPAVEVEGLSPQ